MANTLMGDLQAAFRSITGSVQSYEGDWHTYLDTQGVPKGQWDARVWQYGNLMGLRNHTASSAHEYFLHQGAIGTVSAYAGGFTSSGDYFSTPDSVANSITGDITLIVEAALDDWTPSAVNVLIAKDSVSAGGRSYALNIQTSGAPRFNFSLDGSTIISVTADAIPAFTDGIRSHIAVERTAATGKVRFYTSPDHITWTLLGTEQTAATGNIFDGNAVVQFGNLASLAYDLKGKIYDSEGYAGLAISGTGAVMKFDFDPEDSTGGSSWTSSETGEVWTANGGAYAYKYWGYSPTLSLNFLTGTLDSRITFTRASGATYTDSTGVLQLATSNTPRFDYDPVTLSAKGLLIEEQRTNLLTYSEQFDNAAWGKTATTVTANATTSPDGLSTADKFVESATTAEHYVQSAIITPTASQVYTFTSYVKAAERTQAAVSITGGGTACGAAVFDLSSGTFVGIVFGSAPLSYSISASGNGFYRCSISVTAATTSAMAGRVFSASSGTTNYAGNGTSGLYVWGAQLETGSFATSYIPTTSAQATRAADVAVMTGANFSNWYNQSEGTLYAEFDTAKPSPLIAYAISADDGTTNNFISLRVVSLLKNARIDAVGVTQASLSSSTYTLNNITKGTLAYKVNDFSSSFDGASSVIDSVGTVPVVTRLTLGCVGNDSVAILNGHIKAIAYYNTRLSNTKLQTLTS
jgi:hypothetical protein